VLTLSDGQQVLVGACEDVKEARKIIEELSKYWPGNYAILYRHSRQPVVPNPTRNSLTNGQVLINGVIVNWESAKPLSGNRTSRDLAVAMARIVRREKLRT
jgi:hypothetical protein